MAGHGNLESIVGRKMYLLTPNRVQKIVRIEADKLGDQFAEGVVGSGFDRAPCPNHELGKIIRPKGKLGDDAPTASTSAFQSPIKVGIGAGIRDAYRAVGGDDLRFQESRSSRTKALRETAKPAALHKPSNADIGAASTLYVAARTGRYCSVEIDPHGARFRRNRRDRSNLTLAALANEGIVKRQCIHAARPH